MIDLKNVSKKFQQCQVLESICLTFEDGKTTVLIGPSGCGKSTLLRLIVGLISPTTGQVFIDNEEVNEKSIIFLRRKIGYVIQEGGLFPHLTAIDNLCLLARFLKQSPECIQRRIAYLCDLVQLPKKVLNAYPLQLSGGERQRVSLMRALMLDPCYVLLDEPLAALDPITRHELQEQLKSIFLQLKKTVILVTHDMHEAAFLGDVMILMRAGRLIQKGSLQNLIQNPVESFVTNFTQAQTLLVESI